MPWSKCLTSLPRPVKMLFVMAAVCLTHSQGGSVASSKINTYCNTDPILKNELVFSGFEELYTSCDQTTGLDLRGAC